MVSRGNDPQPASMNGHGRAPQQAMYRRGAGEAHGRDTEGTLQESLTKLCAELDAAHERGLSPFGNGGVCLQPTSVRHALHSEARELSRDRERERVDRELHSSTTTSVDLAGHSDSSPTSASPPNKRLPERATRRTASQGSQGRLYANVSPRYMHSQHRSPSPRPSGEKAADPLLERHKRMIAENGYGKTQPRLYNISEDRRESRRLKQQELMLRRPKDEVLSKHKQMQRRLGYDSVSSRLFHNTFGITSPEPRVASPAHRSRSGGRARKTRSASPRPSTASTARSSSAQSHQSRGSASGMNSAGMPASPLKASPHSSKKSKRAKETSAVNASLCNGGSWEEVAALLKSASASEREGNFNGAEKMHLEVLKIRRKTLGGDHPSIVASLLGLGLLSEAGSRWPAGVVFYTEALQLGRRHMKSGKNVDMHRIMLGLGKCLHMAGRNAEAEPMLRDMLRHASEKHPPDHPLVCLGRYWLSQALLEGPNEGEAEQLAKVNKAMGFTIPTPRSPLRISHATATQT